MARAQILAVRTDHPQPRKIEQAVGVLRQGGVIAYPTDTVYGIGCDLHQRRAIDRVYRIKGVDRGHPLSFICSDVSGVSRYAHVTDFAYRWLRRLLPGPYTVVLEATRQVPRILVERRRTVGIRVPDHAVCQALVRALGGPVISSSATAPDGSLLRDREEIQEHLGSQIDLILDGGYLETVPSTVVSLAGDAIEVLRAGKGRIEGLLQ
jgi:tRNA threonylcarbamoyl adenosine modification protein (Sua5/YciO/YrdC/YwlC family)